MSAPPASIVALALVAAFVLAGCASGDNEETPATPPGHLADALATVGGSGKGGSLGFGWADRALVEDVDGAGRHLIEQAIGPNAETVVTGARRLRNRFGFDPTMASS